MWDSEEEEEEEVAPMVSITRDRGIQGDEFSERASRAA
jgi:hypothetical protein